MADIQCTVTVTPSEQLLLSALVTIWYPQLQIDVTVWHPDLLQIENIIENKLERGDQAAYEYNAARYLHFVDHLVRQALLSVNHAIQEKQKLCSSIVSGFIVGSTVIYIWQPVIGIILDVTVIIVTFLACCYLESQKKNVGRFVANQNKNFKKRAQEFRQAYQQASQNPRWQS